MAIKSKPVFRSATLTKHFDDEQYVTVKAMNQEEISRYSSMVEKQYVRTELSPDGNAQEVTEVVRDYWAATSFLVKNSVIDFNIKDDEGDVFTFDKSDITYNLDVLKALPTKMFTDILKTCNEVNGLTPEAAEKVAEIEKN